MANNHGIITELFPKESRGKALGVLVTAVALGNMVGPSIGGMILSVFNWNYIFLHQCSIWYWCIYIGTKVFTQRREKR